jgi:hypothetical protein
VQDVIPRRASFVASAFAALLAVATAVPAAATPAKPARPAANGHSDSTKKLLSELTVASPHWTGYVRSKFELWTEHPDGCNTRYQVLIRQAKLRPEVESGCYLAGGRWVSPYDGFTTTNPTKIQIDHVVPLAVAWSAGAWKWNANTRMRFANDLGTTYDLIAVSGHSNESKGDQGPDQWLPPKQAFDCRYMADYTAVLWRWHLSIDPGNKHFLATRLAGCGWPNVVVPPRPPIHGGTSTPPREPTSHQCTTTSTGKCIKAGEFCKEADYGTAGYDADGDRLVCTGNNPSHPHWEHQ